MNIKTKLRNEKLRCWIILKVLNPNALQFALYTGAATFLLAATAFNSLVLTGRIPLKKEGPWWLILMLISAGLLIIGRFGVPVLARWRTLWLERYVEMLQAETDAVKKAALNAEWECRVAEYAHNITRSFAVGSKEMLDHYRRTHENHVSIFEEKHEEGLASKTRVDFERGVHIQLFFSPKQRKLAEAVRRTLLEKEGAFQTEKIPWHVELIPLSNRR